MIARSSLRTGYGTGTVSSIRERVSDATSLSKLARGVTPVINYHLTQVLNYLCHGRLAGCKELNFRNFSRHPVEAVRNLNSL